MNRFFVSAAALVLAATAAQAQDAPGEVVTGGHASVYLQPYAGYMVFGDLTDDPALTLRNKPIYGAQLGYSFSPNFSLVGNVGYSPKSQFEINRPGTTVGQASSGDVDVLLYDANLQFKLPYVANRVGSTIAPFAQVGAGAIKFSPNNSGSLTDGPTNVAFNAGLGVDVQIRKLIGLRVMAKDYITSLAFDDFGSTAGSLDNGRDDKLSNNVALTVGLNFGF